MREIVTKFDYFVENIYESVKNELSITQVEETVRTKSTDTKAKAKDENRKIKIKAVNPKDPKEQYRFEFKVVIDNTLGINAVKSTALTALEHVIQGLINQRKVVLGMVAFLSIENPKQRVIGDFISSGVLSFFKSTDLPNISQINPIYTYPFKPISESLSNPGQAIIAEDDSNELKVYNFADLANAMDSSTKKVNMQTLMQASANIEEPEPALAPVSSMSIDNTETDLTNKQNANKYVNLSVNLTPNDLVKDLQAKIIAKSKKTTDNTTDDEAANTILGKGGVDGKYGPATAKAIGILTKADKQPVNMIDSNTSAALVNYLKDVTTSEIENVTTSVVTANIPSDNTKNQDTQAANVKQQTTAVAQKPKYYEVATTNAKIPKLYF